MYRAVRTLALLAGAACSRADPGPAALVDDAGVPIRMVGAPRRIVSLNPATTELVFALGLGDRLVGRTTWCDYPEAARRVPDLGNGIGPNVEAVLRTRPDVVLLYRSTANRATAERLRGFGIAALELRTDRIGDLERVTRLLGRVLGAERPADSLVDWIRRDLEAAERAAGGPSIFLLAWNRPPMTLGRGSFLSEIVERAGARNAFADLPVPSAPIAIEAVARRDPDFVLTQAVELPAFALQPEWQAVRAVRERRFIRVQGSEFSRPSPRIGQAVRKLAAALDSARR